MDQTLYNPRARLYGILSLVALLASFLNGFIALLALVFGILAYMKGEKALGLLCSILSMVFFIAIMSLGVYIVMNDLDFDEVGTGASAMEAFTSLTE